MKKIIYLATLLMINHDVYYAPEEISNPTETTHISTQDDSLQNYFRKKISQIGSSLGQLHPSLGFGDLHQAQQILTKPTTTDTDDINFQKNLNNLDADDKTQLLQHAQKQNVDISKTAFNITSNQEVTAQNSDGSFTIHDLNSFKNPLTTEQKTVGINILKQYFSDSDNPQLQNNAQKLINQTNILSSLSRTQQQDLAPYFFDVVKLHNDPQTFSKLQKQLLEPIKNTSSVETLLKNSIDQYLQDPTNHNTEQITSLLNMYKDSNITRFFNPPLNNPAIKNLIGSDNIVINNMIVNKQDPRFSTPQQAIDTAQSLSKNVLENRNFIRNILQKSMSPDTRTQFFKTYSPKELENFLQEIKTPDEILIDNQLINTKSPNRSITTLYPTEITEFILKTIINKTKLPQAQQIALENFIKNSYQQNPEELATILNKVSLQQAQQMLSKISPTLQFIKPIILDTTKIGMNTSIQQQTQQLLRTFNIDSPSTQTQSNIQNAIAQHLQKQLNITDVDSATNACQQLLEQQKPFTPLIIKNIFDLLNTPDEQQTDFFRQQRQNIGNRMRSLQQEIGNAPTTYQEGYGMAGGTEEPVGVENEQNELDYLEPIYHDFYQLEQSR